MPSHRRALKDEYANLDMDLALDLLDGMIARTAQTANDLAASSDGWFDRIGAGAGVAVRLATLKEAREQIINTAILYHERKVPA
jgi:hypothetical protein